MANWKRGCGIGVGLAVLGVGVFLLTGPGQAMLDIWRTGAIQDAVKGPDMRKYRGDSVANLRAIHTALMLYHDSEGQFPVAAGWMDAIENRMQVGDMEASEAAKKLVRPDLSGQANEYGYALNDAASGKYKDDVGPAGTVLVFESKATGRNAHGKPEPDALSISIDGKLLNEE